MKSVRIIAVVTVLTPLWAAPAPSQSPTAQRGQALLEALAQHYPQMQPTAWGLATDNPRLALFLPQAEWAKLSKEDQVSLTLYVESLIPDVLTYPERYLEIDHNEPHSRLLLMKVATLCAECWLIGVGRLTLNEKGVIPEKVVVEGDSVWERDDPRGRGVKASEFRRGPYAVALVGKEADLTGKGQPAELEQSRQEDNVAHQAPASKGGAAAKVCQRGPAMGGPSTKAQRRATRPRDILRISAGAGAKVRSGPGIECPVIGMAKRGESFPLRGEARGWYAVDYRGREGWVHRLLW